MIIKLRNNKYTINMFDCGSKNVDKMLINKYILQFYTIYKYNVN